MLPSRVEPARHDVGVIDVGEVFRYEYARALDGIRHGTHTRMCDALSLLESRIDVATRYRDVSPYA
jgi:hypothetical protein